jgi:hypothetical protein
MHPVHVPVVPVQKGRVPFSYPDSDGIVHVEGNGGNVSHRQEEDTGPVHYSDRREKPRESRDRRDDDRFERESSSSSRGRYDGRNNDRRDSDRDRGDRGGDRGDYRDKGDRNRDHDKRDEKRDSDRRDSDRNPPTIETEPLEVKKRKRGFQESAEYIAPQDVPIPKAVQIEKKVNVIVNESNVTIDPTEDELRIPTFTEPTESVLAALAAMTQRRKAKISRPLVPSFSESSPQLINDTNKKMVSFSETPIPTVEKKKNPSLLPGLIAYDDDDN